MNVSFRKLLVCTALLCFAGGCAGGPDAQLSSCQQDKDQLLATIRQQRDSNRTMQEQVASLETRLDQAEKELARRTPAGTRLSSQPVERAPLPWRSPGGKLETTNVAAKRTSKLSDSAKPRESGSLSLAALAQRYEQLEYDRQAGAAKVAIDLPFEANAASLTGEGRERLDDLVRLLKSEEAADVRVMVSGHAAGRPAANTTDAETRYASARQLAAARAQAVADYLDSHGIAEERLGIIGTGSRGPRGAATGDQIAGGVEIHLLPPDAPVLGWNTDDTLRR